MHQENEAKIHFDDESHIRVLHPDKFKHTEELSEDCNVFVTKIQDFNSTVHTLVEVLDAHSEKIETEKLKAIGQRNRVTAEAETRETMKKSMHLPLQVTSRLFTTVPLTSCGQPELTSDSGVPCQSPPMIHGSLLSLRREATAWRRSKFRSWRMGMEQCR